MIATILIVSIALYWLARESDYLRIRLLAGCDLVIPEYKVELNTYGVKYKMNIKESGIMTQVMKANKLTKQQKLAYIKGV